MAVAVRLLFFISLEIYEYGGFFSVRSRFVLLMLCFVCTAFLAASSRLHSFSDLSRLN